MNISSHKKMRQISLDPDRLIEQLNTLRREHLTVEGDCWFSCPMREDNYCGNTPPGTRCECGAQAHNERIDSIIKELEDLRDGN